MAEQFLHGVEVVEVDTGRRPIRTVSSGIIGLIGTAPDADESKFPLNEPVLIAGQRQEAAALGSTGTLVDALDGIFDQIGAVVVVIRVDEGADESETLANVVGGTDDTTGAYTGVHAFLGAGSAVGQTPRILCAAGWSHQRPEDPLNSGSYLANPVVAELVGIASKLRAVVVADGPNTTDDAAQTYREDISSPRVYVVDPWAKIYDTSSSSPKDVPASARVAGVMARTDADLGFWHSPSNKPINGIIGTGRGVDFILGDTASRANLLNEHQIATIIRQDGFRLWGNEGCGSDPKWQFLSVRRTADIINDSLLRAHLWAVDRNITKTYVDDVTDSVNAYLRHLVNIGAILGGSCWADPDLNTPDQIALGKVYFDFDFTPPYPAQTVTFRSNLTQDYLEEITA